MGNQHSNSGTTRSHRHHRSGVTNGPFRRSTGRLGLTKVELDIRCKPSGLYDSCSWDDKVIRRLVSDGDIAARLEGTDSRTQSTDQECPICFLHYTDINLLSCCKATICSECYLQIQDPRAMDTPCPFCNQPKMEVKIAKRLEIDEVSKRDEEEQRIIEAKIKSKIEGLSGNCNNNSNSKSLNPQNDDADTVADGDAEADGDGNGDGDKNKENNGSSFGSNLDRAMRSRARTLSSELHESFGVFAMSPEERRNLEQEMSSQSQHPLLRRMNLEAEQESDRHVLEHMNSRRDRNRASREQFERLMNWTSRNARERRATTIGGDGDRGRDGDGDGDDNGGNDSTPAVPSLNDLIMLEAAMYLSMREEPRSRRRSRIRNGRGLMFLGRDNQHHNEADPGDPLQEREREHDRMEAANLFQSLVRDRMMTTEEEEPNDDQLTGSITDRLLTELSEARQIEMAIQMSLQEAQEREQSASEENTNTGETNAENEEGSGNNEDSAEAEAVTITTAATATYDEVNISNSVDHGEEEVTFDQGVEDA